MSAINLGGGGSKKLIDEVLGQVHEHDNILVLDDLNDSNGVLTYKGKEIITSGSNSTILATQVIETTDRKFVNKKEKDSLSGVKSNIQSQIDIVKMMTQDAMRFKGRYNSYAAMIAANPTPTEGDTVFIDVDEKQNNCKTIYIYKTSWVRVRQDKESSGWIASTTAPSDKTILWLDVSGAEPKLKWFNGTTWVDISGLTTVPASKVIQETNLKFVNDTNKKILDKLSEDTENKTLLYDGKPLGGGTSAGALIKDDTIEIDSTYSSFKIVEELKKKQTELGYIPENTNKKGVANGYAPLNSNAKVPKENLISFTYIVNSITERDNIADPEHGSTCYIEATTEQYVYATNNKWLLIAKGDSIFHGKHNYEGTRKPVYDDDITKGFSIGSIWVNTLTQKAYICTCSTKANAVWDLMAGAITFNIGEIIPFKLDPVTSLKKDDKFYYKSPDMSLDNDYMELTVNGHELIKDVHYKLYQDNTGTYIELTEELKATDYIFGEIFKYDLNKAEEQMLKSAYDSNNNGKVDLSELADTAKKLQLWAPNTRYKKGEIVFRDGVFYVSIEDHTSGLSFIESEWYMIKSEAYSLDKFTTEDLTPTNNRGYVTSEQIADIESITSLASRTATNERNISTNTRDISTLKSSSTSLTNRLDNLKFTQLVDTTSNLIENSYLKVILDNKKNPLITTVIDPMFDIKAIVDSSDTKFSRISIPKFNHMRMVNDNNGTFEFSLDATTFDLNDMPTIHEHGKVLVSDVNNQKYVLANKEELTMSVENFNCVIEESDWQEVGNKFEKVVYHDMASESVIVSFTDLFKFEDKTITYEVIDEDNIKIYSDKRKKIKCVINCALGAGNGYWQYLMDWSKIDFVDDSRIRTDRAYSSSKLEGMLKSYALKNDYYTKNLSDSRFAIKSLEHDHQNKTVIDKLCDIKNDLYYNNKKVLTEIKPITYSNEEVFDTSELTEVISVEEIYESNFLQAIVAAEILVQNVSDKDMTFKIRDNSFDLLTITLAPNEVQKYHLGISNKIKIFINGKAKTLISVSAF